MFSNRLILEIIKSDLSIIPGLSKLPSDDDIIIKNNLIKIRVQLMINFNIRETSKMILNQLRFKLIDKTDNKDFKINLVIYI